MADSREAIHPPDRRSFRCSRTPTIGVWQGTILRIYERKRAVSRILLDRRRDIFTALRCDLLNYEVHEAKTSKEQVFYKMRPIEPGQKIPRLATDEFQFKYYED